MLNESEMQWVLSALRRVEDGLRSSVDASIGVIETGGETAERFQSRMELTAERVWKLRHILEIGKLDPGERQSRLWEVDVEEEYTNEDEDDDEEESEE